MILKIGDPVRIRFGMSKPPKYKRGTFYAYSQDKKYGKMIHIKTGKVLKRLAEEFEKEEE